MTLTLPKYTFISGPPESGKSTLAKLIVENTDSTWKDSFAQPIRDMIYSVFYPEEGPISFSFDLRDADAKARSFTFAKPPISTLSPLTNRDVMISFAQKWMKPMFGEDIFGRLLHARCLAQEDFYSKFVIDDAGFLDELKYIVDQEGFEHCLLIQLYRDGCTFTKDSRGYLYPTWMQVIELENNNAEEDLLDALESEFTASL